MNDNPVVDPAALDRLREWGGEKLLTQMIRLYIENARDRVAQVDSGLSEGGELAEAERGAHSLKSSAANVGARRVNVIAQQMEDAAEARDETRVRELRGPLGSAVDEAETELNRILEQAEG